MARGDAPGPSSRPGTHLPEPPGSHRRRARTGQTGPPAARAGLAVVLVEHDMSLVMSISQDIVVLDAGRVIARGTPAVVQADERVIEAYVGRTTDTVAS